MEELPPVLDQGEVPFAPPPRGFARTRKFIKRVSRKREKPPSELAIATLALAYFGGALAVCLFNQGYLLAAWLTTGPLFVTVYLTFDGIRGSLLNPYTLFFAAVLVACVAGFCVSG